MAVPSHRNPAGMHSSTVAHFHSKAPHAKPCLVVVGRVVLLMRVVRVMVVLVLVVLAVVVVTVVAVVAVVVVVVVVFVVVVVAVTMVTVAPGCPISSHNLISFNNIYNILRYLYGKTPHNNRKCGRRLGYL